MITLKLRKSDDAESLVLPSINSDWPNLDTFKLYDQDIPVSSKDGIIWVPNNFLDDGTDWSDWLPKLADWALSGEEITQAKRWIIGSAKLSIDGTERTASSHRLGTAIDMTPLWRPDEGIILDPDGSCPALAWNLLFLTGLAQYHSDSLCWAVEGDHIHFSNSGNPSLKDRGVVAVATTIAPAYPISQYADAEAFSNLINKGFVFDAREDTIIYAPIDNLDEMLEYLGDL